MSPINRFCCDRCSANLGWIGAVFFRGILHRMFDGCPKKARIAEQDHVAAIKCAVSGHTEGKELPSTDGKWSFKECSHCGRLRTTKRPPPETVTV